jgi:hypothetical protein
MSDDAATTTQPMGYRAYLLRLWRASGARWRAALEDAHTGDKRAFANLGQLLVFLVRELGDGAPAQAEGDEGRTAGEHALTHLEQLLAYMRRELGGGAPAQPAEAEAKAPPGP